MTRTLKTACPWQLRAFVATRITNGYRVVVGLINVIANLMKEDQDVISNLTREHQEGLWGIRSLAIMGLAMQDARYNLGLLCDVRCLCF